MPGTDTISSSVTACAGVEFRCKPLPCLKGRIWFFLNVNRWRCGTDYRVWHMLLLHNPTEFMMFSFFFFLPSLQQPRRTLYDSEPWAAWVCGTADHDWFIGVTDGLSSELGKKKSFILFSSRGHHWKHRRNCRICSPAQ